MAHLNGASSSRGQTPCDLTEDRLTWLPWHVLNVIFSYLPILDAVRTSVLAKEWRYRWLALSDFALDSSTIPSRPDTEPRWDIISGVVNRYLLHHTYHIKKFYLRTNLSSHYPDMHQWVQCLSRQNVEELSLQESSLIGFVVPSHLFAFKNLGKLSLVGGVINIPSEFGGFTFLREASFTFVRIEGDDLVRLIRTCPILENLTLFNIYGVNILRIQAPRLSCLSADTSVDDIVIEAAPFLSTVVVVDAYRRPRQRVIFNSYGVIRSLFGLGYIKLLVLSGDVMKLLAVKGFENFPWTSSTVMSLMLHDMRFEKVEMFRVCLSLLNSCPNIQHFYFTIRSAKGPRLITKFLTQIQGQYSFPEIRTLEMLCPSGIGMGCSVNFLEYISANCPILQFLTVERHGREEMNRTRLLKILARLQIPCPRAVVRYVHCGPRTKHIFYHH